MIQLSERHKVVGVPHRADLASLFPKAKVVDFKGSPMILLPHSLQETLMLRNMGFDVPAPILSQYKFPGKKPFEVQRKTCAVMTTHQRAYVLNGMGTGKTACTLWSYDYLRGIRVANKMLVVAPLSTLDNVWRREAFRMLPHLSVGVLHGSKKKRLKVLGQDHDIYVINTDGLTVILDELLARKDINTMAIDELALFRNGGAARNRAARKLSAQMVWLWGLTGSPTPTEPTDAWGQCKIITPHTVPKFFGRFRDDVMTKVSNFVWKPKRDATETVFNVMQPAVRYTLDDVVELPQVVVRPVDIAMDDKHTKIYETMRQHSFVAVKKDDVTAVNAGAMLNKLLQISLGYVYSDTRGVVRVGDSARLDQLVDDVNASARKVLVFCPFVHALDGVVERLQKEGLDFAKVSGATPKKDRDHAFTLFQQTNKLKGIVAHPQCMSHGLTLTEADTVIWFGPTTSLETFEQANARVRRIGQKHKQLVLLYQSTEAEKKIYSRLRSRQKVQDNLLEMFADNTVH